MSRTQTRGNSTAIEYVGLEVHIEAVTNKKVVSNYVLCVIEHKPVPLLLDTGVRVIILNKETVANLQINLTT